MKMRSWMTCAVLSAGLLAGGTSFAQEQKNNPNPVPPLPPAAVPPSQAIPTVDPNKPAGRLQISTTEWNFGQIWYGETDPHTEVELKNVGNAPLNKIEAKTSCGCTLGKLEKNSLAPGETTKLTVSYNSKKKTGLVNQTVTINSDDPVQPVMVVAVRGDVKPFYEMQPPEGLIYGRLARDAAEARKVVIVNKFDQPFTLKLKQDSAGQYYNVELKELEPGKKWEVTATTKPPLPTRGAIQTDILLETSLERIPEIKVRAYAMVMPRVDLNRTELYVPKSMPRPMEQQLRMTYMMKQPVKITSIKPSLDKIKAEVLPQQSNQQQTNQPFGWYDIKVTLPEGKEIPDTGAIIEINTDAAEPEYAKFLVRVTNKPPQGIATSPKPAPAPGATPQPTGPVTDPAGKPAETPKPATNGHP